MVYGSTTTLTLTQHRAQSGALCFHCHAPKDIRGKESNLFRTLYSLALARDVGKHRHRFRLGQRGSVRGQEGGGDGLVGETRCSLHIEERRKIPERGHFGWQGLVKALGHRLTLHSVSC